MLIFCLVFTEQAQFGACGRILVVVMEGVRLKPRSASGKQASLPASCLMYLIQHVQLSLQCHLPLTHHNISLSIDNRYIRHCTLLEYVKLYVCTLSNKIYETFIYTDTHTHLNHVHLFGLTVSLKFPMNPVHPQN